LAEGTLCGVSYRCPHCGGEVDLGRTPLESGLVRLAAVGADGFSLHFDEPALAAAAGPLLGPCPHGPAPAWDAEALRPLASRGWDVLAAAPALAGLAELWRPRALALAGRADELSPGDVLRGRLAARLEELAGRIEAARRAGDEDEAERLHARYIELGMTYAGRLASA